MKLRFAYPFVLGVAALLPCHISPSSAGAEPPNIVLIFADDLGYGDLSSYGHPTIQTPNLDRLATQGIRFTSFYTAPWCVPARIQLMLGRYPARMKLGPTSVDGAGGIPDEEVTLAEALKSAGYRTGMMGKWHLGYQQEKYLPVGQGFDYWFGLPYSNDMRKPWVNTETPLWLYENSARIEHPVNQDTLTTRYTERAIRFIRQNRDRRFFLYLAHSMPHLPVHTTDAFRGKSRAGLYGDVIETIDWSAGKILETLDKLGLENNTIVIFTSDNGPWLNLPGRMLREGNEKWHTGSPGLLRGAKGTSHEGGVRVPCIIRWPGHIPEGRVSADMASTLDLYATLIKSAGGRLPDLPIDGYDLMPFWTGRTPQSPREEFYYFHGGRLDGMRSGPWKLRLQDGVELFNLDLDPSERYNRADEKPELVARLKRQLERMADETDAVKTWE